MMLIRQINKIPFVKKRYFNSKLLTSTEIDNKSYIWCFFESHFGLHRKNFHYFHHLYTSYWDYSKEHGPDHWQEIWEFKNCQSPIDIIKQNIEYDNSLKPLELITKPIQINARNLGFNISFLADNFKSLVLCGGPLKYNYAFREMHFHWGEVHKGKCNLGCEHTFDGKRFAAELHVVHWNTDLYETDMQAMRSKDGLTVIGLLIDASDLYEQNKEFNFINETFRKVLYPNEHTIINISPYFLFPSCVQNYYTYSGSLTIPPLSENVTWVLFPDPIRISFNQLSDLSVTHSVEKNSQQKARHLSTEAGSTIITNNFRPIQPLNNRIVRSSFKNLI
ncbi:carbonic anhydrase 13-like [Hydra vulgaris]|uniref:Carbonic anhydrase 13-like n=1 Tax=Hydra vulgaris TaxID=6087 RepID=A0ABM4BXD1_HYDVU